MVHMLAEDVESPLAGLWREVAQAHFLGSLSMPEALAALEQWHELADLLLTQTHGDSDYSHCDDTAAFMMDHYHELLEAELAWLDRSISSLRSSVSLAPD